MRFEDLALGELRQIDGPFSGVKVLDADETSGAKLTVNDLAWPLRVFPSYVGRVSRIIATGPLLLVLAESEDESVEQFAASPVPPGRPTSGVIWEQGFQFAAGDVADTGHLTAYQVDRVWASYSKPGSGVSIGIQMWVRAPGSGTEFAVESSSGTTTAETMTRIWMHNEATEQGQSTAMSTLSIIKMSLIPEDFRIRASGAVSVPTTLVVRAIGSRLRRATA